MGVTAILLFSTIAFFSWFVCNIHSRYIFVAIGANQKGTYNRRRNSYKKKWSMKQRVLLIPLLQASKSAVYRFLAVLNWIHFFVALTMSIVVCLDLCFSMPFLIQPVACVWLFVLLLNVVVNLTVARTP